MHGFKNLNLLVIYMKSMDFKNTFEIKNIKYNNSFIKMRDLIKFHFLGISESIILMDVGMMDFQKSMNFVDILHTQTIGFV